MLFAHRKIVVTACLIAAAVPQLTHAAAAARREHFLSYGPGVAATAMGGAAVAACRDLSAFYYNPALLAQQDGYNISASHFMLYDTARYDFIGFAHGWDKTSFALAGTQLSRDNIEMRLTMGDEPQTIRNSQAAIYAAYASYINRFKLYYGAALKYLDYGMGTYTGTGYGIDVGLARRLLIVGSSASKRTAIDAGLTFQNAAQIPMKLISEEEPLPAAITFGLASTSALFPRYNREKDTLSSDELTIASDARYEDETVTVSAGLQYRLMNTLYLRCGYSNGLSLGTGFEFGDLVIDYAYQMRSFTAFHRMGFTYRFGRQEDVESRTAQAFTDDFQNIYQKAQRIYNKYYRDATAFAEEKNYSKAIALLNRALPLAPKSLTDTQSFLFTCEQAQIAGRTNEHLTKAISMQNAGDGVGAYRECLGALSVSPACNVQGIISDITASAKNKQLCRPLYDARLKQLVSSVTSAVEAGDFAAANHALAVYAALASSSTTLTELRRTVKDRKDMLVYEYVSAGMKEMQADNHSVAYQYFSTAESLVPEDAGIRDQKNVARKKFLAAKTLSMEEQLYADKLYYLAAIAFATDDESQNAYNELVSFNPTHQNIPVLEACLIKNGVKKRLLPSRINTVAKGE